MMARIAWIAGLFLLLVPQRASAHCDTIDGPVVSAARTALESGDLEPLLRWVPAESEAEVALAFERTREVRTLAPAARELADRWFFETVVRLHRAGEGEPFTGIAPAGTPLEPAVAAVDEALKTGNPDRLVHLLTSAVEAGVRPRFRAALEARAHADESVPRGRDFVHAYVELMHHTEHLLALAEGGHTEDETGKAQEPPEHR